MFTSFIAFASGFMLIGCDNDRNTDAICKNNPELCEDLHRDSWCRYEKGDLIRQRFVLKSSSSPTGKEIYDQLRFLEVYSKCIELAAGVQHKINVSRTNDRIRAFGISVQNLEELQQSTRGAKEPHLAYYHWSRFNDVSALNVLLKAEADGKIDDPELLSKLAIYFLKVDANKSRTLYLDVLARMDAEHTDPDWLLGLATASRTLDDLESSYLYSRANVLLTGQGVDEAKMLLLVNGDKHISEWLDEQADALASAIKSGSFSGSAIEATLRAKADVSDAKNAPDNENAANDNQ
ncbi:DUF2989 domain-containing protein [Shewanella sp.]|uniref:DUF2989 domain-containing protein n=1 Tax=Shewanella sp. TaxID=50422 RepID=UPI0035688624